VPQDIPVEASETLAFTPPSLEDHDPKPVFMLRAVTSRDKRFYRKLMRSETSAYGIDAFRREFIAGLEALSDKASFAKYEPRIRALWERRDEFELQSKDDPDLKWDFDPEEEGLLNVILGEVEAEWRAIKRMKAANADFQEMLAPITIATVVKSWSGFDVRRELSAGYLSLDCAVSLFESLEEQSPLAASELFVACTKRMTLEKDEEKNSASPSPSETTPPASTPMTTSAEADGKSPASAVSTEIPASASETSIGSSSGSTANATEELLA